MSNATITYTCRFTNKTITAKAKCPQLQLDQAARYALTPSDAVMIATSRFKKANELRAERSRNNRRKREQAFSDSLWMAQVA